MAHVREVYTSLAAGCTCLVNMWPPRPVERLWSCIVRMCCLSSHPDQRPRLRTLTAILCYFSAAERGQMPSENGTIRGEHIQQVTVAPAISSYMVASEGSPTTASKACDLTGQWSAPNLPLVLLWPRQRCTARCCKRIASKNMNSAAVAWHGIQWIQQQFVLAL